MRVPKILLTAALTVSPALSAYIPTQTDLQAYLGLAARAWGVEADVQAIQLGEMNACRADQPAAYTDLRSRVITVNSACRWTRQSLLGAITHEYGHMLAGDATHDASNKRSVMYYRLGKGQRITEDNRSYVALQAEYRKQRPTILKGDTE